jgi:hypothetical protein
LIPKFASEVAAIANFGIRALGAQTFAAAGAPCGEHLAATGRGDARAEAMAALAHQFAGLVSPLHGWFSAETWPAGAGDLPDR